MIQGESYILADSFRNQEYFYNVETQDILNRFKKFDDDLANEYIGIISAIPPMPEKVNRLIYFDELKTKSKEQERESGAIISKETDEENKKFLQLTSI